MKRYMQKISDLRGLAAKTKIFGVAGTTGVITALVASSVVQATDLQIYTVPTAGKKTIVMMLDTSGSMNYVFNDYGVCDNTNSNSGTSINSTTTGLTDNRYYKLQATTETPYERRFCYVSKSNTTSVPAKVSNIDSGCEKVGTTGRIYRCYDRITRLKDGMFALLDNNSPVLNAVSIGLGYYSLGGNGKAGVIVVPAKPLGPVDSDHRQLLKNKLKNLKATGNTPTGHAFAEAAAYLMGSNTRTYGNFNKDIYKKVTASESVAVVPNRYECTNPAYSHFDASDNRCYQSTGFSGTDIAPSTKTVYSCNDSSNLLQVGSGVGNSRFCARSNRTFSGNPTTEATTISECTDSSYPYLVGSKCFNNAGNNSINVASRYICNNNTYKYLKGQTCYKSISSTTDAGISSHTQYTCSTTTHPYLNFNNKRCYQRNTGFYGLTIPATLITELQPVTRYYQCQSWENINFTAGIQKCNNRESTTSSWIHLGTTPPDDLADFTESQLNSNSLIYQQNVHDFSSTNSNSGFEYSDISTKDPEKDNKAYLSPLPAVADRQSCDGQGVYLLSDGQPNGTVDSNTMAAALKQDSFNKGTDELTQGSSEWGWMGEFAKKLFNGGIIQTSQTAATNPVNVPIQTAFVGFGGDFNNLSSNDVISACKLSSRSQVDRSSDDKCSPNQSSNATRQGGYGNGGFFIANNANDVTNSVIQFINNLGVAPLDPLSTGAISVPVDALNPSGFQPYGYLRALEPNPAIPVKVWIGNLKKYSIENGALKADAETVFDQSGIFNKNTKDIWNITNNYDGGLVRQGGVYSQLPMPTTSNPSNIRNLLTDVALDSLNNPVKMSDFTQSLLKIPKPEEGKKTIDAFNNQSVLEKFSTPLKLKLLNYLGFDLDLTSNETLPAALTAPEKPFISIGGSIHSFPVQLTYSGDLDAFGNLTDIRKQSVLYGSMEGALRIVDAETGKEQMVFVPADILLNEEKSRALRLGEGGEISHGVSGAWVADSTYQTVRSLKPDMASTVKAKTMNVYGGLRMGGESYYGLNVLEPTEPKVLFRIGSDKTGFERMGQTWSKPVLINVRHSGKIKRAMVVGGGYDMCYENPRFKLGTANPIEFQIKNSAGEVIDNCNKTSAKGNAIFIVDAITGEKLWWASNGAPDTSTAFYSSNPNLKHSIVSRISTLDRDGDGLVDHLYFGDLGGQVFRVDLDNNQNFEDDEYSNFGVRVVRLANLGQSLKADDSGDLNTNDNGDSPRFYQPPTITIHDQGLKTFIAVSIASGDRSTPLDVTPTQGRETILPTTALTNRPVNNVYSIFDHDFIKKTLIKGAVTLDTKNLVLSHLQKDPQLLEDGTYISTFFTQTGFGKYGWYRSLSSQYDGTELAGRAVGGVTRVAGGVKAFEEEPIAISNNFFVPIYDPQGNSIAVGDPCKPRIVGESNRQQYCLPYGVCLNAGGYKNINQESKTGFQLLNDKNTNVLGAGIRGITLGPKDSSSTVGKNACTSLTLLGNIKGAGQWDCQRILNPTKWYEKYVAAK